MAEYYLLILYGYLGAPIDNKCLYELLECFSILITDVIVEEITKLTDAEIQPKIQKPGVKAFKTTNCKKKSGSFRHTHNNSCYERQSFDHG